MSYLILNQAGQSAVRDFVNANVAKRPQSMTAWFDQAEYVANCMTDTADGEAIELEIRRLVTVSGNPETITLPLFMFDNIATAEA